MKKLFILTAFLMVLGLTYAKAQTIDITNNTCHTMTTYIYYDDPNGNCGPAISCRILATQIVVINPGQTVTVAHPCPGYEVWVVKPYDGGPAAAWLRPSCGSSVKGEYANGPCFGTNHFQVQSGSGNTVFEINPI